MTNPAWPDFVKIGCAGDVNKRLSQFNTGSPRRDYEMAYVGYSEDCEALEARIHRRFASVRADGEWFRLTAWDAMVAVHEMSEADPFCPATGVSASSTSGDTP